MRWQPLFTEQYGGGNTVSFPTFIRAHAHAYFHVHPHVHSYLAVVPYRAVCVKEGQQIRLSCVEDHLLTESVTITGQQLIPITSIWGAYFKLYKYTQAEEATHNLVVGGCALFLIGHAGITNVDT